MNSILQKIKNGDLEGAAMELYQAGRYEFLSVAILDCFRARRMILELDFFRKEN